MRKSFAALTIASLVSSPVFAANTISESMSPGSMLVLSTGGQSMASFFVSVSDFPSGTSLDQKTLTAVDWDTTYYPEAADEIVDLCYYEPYQAAPARCIEIAPNSNGSTAQFNDLRFEDGVQISVVHGTEEATDTFIYPNGEDAITLVYDID